MNKYKIIYVDCPHDYDNKNSNGATPYPTLTDEELKKIPVSSIAAKDAVLLYWTTWPKIFEAKGVIEAWGFKYITAAFVWEKTYSNGDPILGLGHYTRGCIEPCLLAKRGKISRLDTATNISQLIVAPRREHSAKPPIVRNRIVDLFGDLPRIELFARERVDGWDALGNELDGMDIRKSIHLINICQNVKLN